MPLIAFTSPKGGVGKTTLTAQVAAMLARRGHAVLALDLDPQNALRLHLGRPMREEAGFMVELARRPDWRRAMQPTASGVQLLPHGAADQRRALELGMALLDHPELLVAPVREMLADPQLVVLLDSPPGASAALSALAPLADLLVVVLLADAASASLVPQVVGGRQLGRGTLAARMAERSVVVLNQVDLDSPLSRDVMDMSVAALGERLIGAVCRDERVAEALGDKRLLADDPPGFGGAAEDLVLLTDAIVSMARLPPPGRPRGARPALLDWGFR